MDEDLQGLLGDDDSVFEALFNDTGMSVDLVEDSFSSIVGTAPNVTSTPVRRGRGGSRGRGRRENVPDRIKCTMCPKTYANEHTFAVHKKSHAMKIFSTRIPSYDDLKSAMPQLVIESLQDLIQERPVRDFSENLKKYIQAVLSNPDLCTKLEELSGFLSEHYLNMLLGEKKLFPSAITTEINKGTNKLLSQVIFRDKVKSSLQEIENAPNNIINVLCGIFVTTLSTKVLSFVVKKLRGDEGTLSQERMCKSTEDFQSASFKRNVFHVSGWILSACIWIPKNKTKEQSQLLVNVLKTKFLENESCSNACPDEIKQFTAGIDRGGLKHINIQAFDFFMLLFQTIMCLEGEDGSLPFSVVEENLLNQYDLLGLWDKLIERDLSDEQSLGLFLKFSEYATNVCQKGILKRLANQNLLKPVSSVPLRPRLAH